MDNGNRGPVYVVLGATGGIGAELCRGLAEDGGTLVVGGRDAQKLDALAEDLGAHTVSLDATNPKEVEGIFETAVQEYGRVDGAANLVGSFLIKPAHLTSDEEWSETLALNLNTAFATVRAAAKHMQEGGSVVLMSSVAARVGLANHEAIAAAKAGVLGLALSAAASYASRGLRFNVVAPGLIQTNLTRNVTKSETARQASTDLHPLGRLGEPGDVAPLIQWLLQPSHSWVTGQVFGIDGGLSTLRPMPRRSSKSS